MLTLEGALRCGPFTVFRDAAREPAAAPLLWVLPDRPRLARDPDGGPAIALTRYLPPTPDPARTRGTLVLTTELAWTPAEEQALRADLASQLGPDGPAAEALTLRPVPLDSGTVHLAALGEEGEEGETDGVRVLGGGRLALAGEQRATFLVELDGPASELAWAALAEGATALQVRYEVGFLHRLDAVEVRIWADAGGLPEDFAGTAADAAALLRGRAMAGIEVVEAEGADLAADAREELIRQADDLLAGFLRGAATDGDRSAVLRVTWTGDEVLRHTTALDAPLAPDPEALAGRLTEVRLDPGFFTVLEVPVVCPALDPEGPVRAVEVVVRHLRGDTLVRARELLFGGEGGHALFRSAAGEGGGDRLEATVAVHYRDRPEPWRRPPVALAPGELLALDPEALGVFQATLLRSAHAADGWGPAAVELEIPELSRREVVVLDAASPTARWGVSTARAEPPAARRRATWTRDDGATVDTPWEPLQPGRTFVAPPSPDAGTARVELLAAGSFEGIVKVLAELRPIGDTADSHRQLFELTAPGQQAVWTPPATPGVALEYAWRQIVVYADGTRHETPWETSGRPVLVVRDRTVVEVLIDPRLVDFGRWALVRLDLAFDDPPSGAAVRHAVTLTDAESPASWRFRTPDPARRTWRHRELFVGRDGTRRSTDWRESRADILVVVPPDPAPGPQDDPPG